VSDWQQALARKWSALRFGEMTVETEDGQHAFLVHVYLNDLDPEAVRVELYADGIPGGATVRQEMARLHQLVAAATGYAYHACLPADRPASDYTARLIPRHDGASVPLEAPQILWQR
jgi:starch phosphorylase